MKIYEEYPDLQDHDFIEAFDFSTCYTKTNPDDAFAELDVAAALIKCYGNLTMASRLLGRSRASLSGFVARNNHFRDLQEEINAVFMDTVEYHHMQLALKGDGGTQRFFLTTKGKDRGFTTRQEHTGKGGAPIQMITNEMSEKEAADAYAASLNSD